MKDSFQLKAIITGVDKLSPELSKIDRKLKETDSSARSRRRRQTEEEKQEARLRKAQMAAAAERSRQQRQMYRDVGAMSIAATAGLTAVGVAYARQEEAGVSLQTSMMKSGGVVDASYDQINQKAIELGSRLPGSTADFQNMMETLVSQGITAESILSGVGEAAANLAVQLKMPPTQAALAMAEYQDATGATGEQLLRLADSAQRAYYMGVKLEDSVQFFSKVRPALKMIAKDGAEASEALQPISVALQQAAMDSSSAGNAMNKIFQAPLDKKKLNKVNKSLARKGLKFDFFDKKGNFKGVENFIVQLEKMKKLNSFQQKWVKQTLWGNDSETDTALSVVSDMGLEGYQKIQKKMSDQASLNERVGASLNTVTNRFDAMTGSAENAAGAIGKQFEPHMKTAADGLDSFANGVTDFAKENPKAIRAFTDVGVAIAGAGAALVAVNIAMALLAANPLTLSIVGIAAAAGLLVAHTQDLREIAEENNKAQSNQSVNSIYGFDKNQHETQMMEKYNYIYSGKQFPATENLKERVNELMNDMGAMQGKFPQMITSWRQAPSFDYGPKQGFLEGGINQLRGTLEVKFENAPEGMKVSDAKTSLPGFDIKSDVGYSPFMGPYRRQ